MKFKSNIWAHHLKDLNKLFLTVALSHGSTHDSKHTESRKEILLLFLRLNSRILDLILN